MKQFLLSFTFSLYFLSVFGQTTWCPPGAQWHYGYGAWGILGYNELTVVGDTVIDGIPCKHLNEFVSYHDYINGGNGQSSQPRYTYEQNGIVYFHSSSWDTIINFNATIGESWSMNADGDDPRAVVIDTGHNEINGYMLKWIIVEYTNFSFFNDTIYERMGFTGMVYPFSPSPVVIDGDYNGFCNYSDDTFNDYKNFDSVCT